MEYRRKEPVEGTDQVPRKRVLKQQWVINGEAGKYNTKEMLIRDKRKKTASVFDRISELNNTTADPAEEKGRREL